MNRLQIALGVAVVVGGVIATRAAIAEKRVETARREGIAALLAQIEALEPAKGHSTLHVTFNGVGSVVSFAANDAGKSVGELARQAAEACGGDADGDVANSDVIRHRETKEFVSREDTRSGDASAVFCVTRGEDGSRTSRMTFVQPSSTTTLTTKDASVDAMFPRDRSDVPGDDLAHVRPANSVRVGAASVLETGHAVRMYDLAHPSPGDIALDELDIRMKTQGFASSAAVANEVEGMRLYVRDGERLVVSFERDAQGNVTRVTIARVNLL